MAVSGRDVPPDPSGGVRLKRAYAVEADPLASGRDTDEGYQDERGGNRTHDLKLKRLLL